MINDVVREAYMHRATVAQKRAIALLKGSLYGYPDGEWTETLMQRARAVLDRTMYVTVYSDGDVEIYSRYSKGRVAITGWDYKVAILGTLAYYL